MDYYSKRLGGLIKYIEQNALGGFLVRKKQNVSYLSGTRGEDAVLFISPKNNILITDSRYEEEYKKSIKNSSLLVTKNKNMLEGVADACREAGSKRIGFEADNFSYAAYSNLKKTLKNTKLVPCARAVETLRMIKDKSEIGYVAKACEHGSRIMNQAVKFAKPGTSEKNVKIKIQEYAMKNNLAFADFDIIVASGKNSSMPHAMVSDKKIKKNEMVIIDLGARYSGYNSDLTRTVFLGKINHKYLHIYTIVLEAQKKAIERIKPGMYAKDIDAVSRRYISEKGMGRYFLHSLGHGIGRETHEIPAISRNSEIRLEKDMVITIEPGVYVPGWGGIRIEDTVLVTENGCKILTEGADKYAGRD